MHATELEIATPGRGFVEIGGRLDSWLAGLDAVGEGLLQLFIRHTSASLIVCENADPDVLTDLQTWMAGLVRDGDRRFRHRAEGDDDMAAHVRSVLTASSLALPVSHGRLALGTWQGVFVWEHRYRPHRRRLALRYLS